MVGFWDRFMIQGVIYMISPVSIMPKNTNEKTVLTELCRMRAWIGSIGISSGYFMVAPVIIMMRPITTITRSKIRCVRLA